MRVVICPDSFTGTLSAVEAAAAIATGWRRVAPEASLDVVALSDGGPGFVTVLHSALGGDLRTARVSDPLGRPIDAHWLLTGPTAYIESAAACGLHLLTVGERDPSRATTHGVGELVAAALDAGATRIVVGLGGSATNDGGRGLVEAFGGLTPAVARMAGVDLVAATDVDNPLIGIAGASAVFGPQKGATAEQVLALDAALETWAGELAAGTGRDVRDEPGAGAAGGLGAALFALGAARVSGIGLVLGVVGLGERIAAADLVVTGEGSFDWQSLRGKAVAGVAALAREHAVPCLVLAGRVLIGRREAAAAGVEETQSLIDAVGETLALAAPAASLADVAARVAGRWSRAGG